jgi:hypothetical protein
VWLAFCYGYVVDRDEDLTVLMARCADKYGPGDPDIKFRHISELYKKDRFEP